MSDDTPQVQDAPPDTAVNSPAAPAIDPATAAAIAQAVIAGLQANQPPAPAPVTPTTVPAAATAVASSATSSAAADPVDEPPYSEVFKPGSLAVHTYDHFGRETHQVLLVLGTYQTPKLDKRGNPTGEMQDRVRFLPVGTANGAGDLPADAPELLPANQFDWEEPA